MLGKHHVHLGLPKEKVANIKLFHDLQKTPFGRMTLC
jgi:hypothetical protein